MKLIKSDVLFAIVMNCFPDLLDTIWSNFFTYQFILSAL